MTAMLKRTAAALALAGIVAGTLAPLPASAEGVAVDRTIRTAVGIAVPSGSESIVTYTLEGLVFADTAQHSQSRPTLTFTGGPAAANVTNYLLTVNVDPPAQRISFLVQTHLDAATQRPRSVPGALVVGDTFNLVAKVRGVSGNRGTVTVKQDLYDPVVEDFTLTDTQTVTITVPWTGPETPDPETPTEPETPDPGTQACTYEHRIVGVPGTTGGGYIGRVWVSSKKDDATARIRAYQGDNGHELDVLDGSGRAIGPVVSLSPANSIKQFRTEGARGWHVVTVTHATARAMHSASVVLRIRGSDGVQMVPIPPSEHCEPASSTTQ